ncbi:MAG: FAD-dependent monooxygenase [Rhodobacter sp.]|nr:FAD-dependent monooxygenase [Rhodobacter sp.]
MSLPRSDIFISGGGIAGLVAAAAFGHAGFSVVLADPTPAPDTPADTSADTGADLRSTAFLHPARALLDEIGLWQALAPLATPLDALRIVDTTGWPPEIAETRIFSAQELDQQSFGWNLPNWQTRAELLRFIRAQPGITFLPGVGFAGMLARTNAAIVSLSDGSRLGARLVIGADGRASPVREAAGIGVSTTRYGQKALAFTATHPLAHENISTEIYNRGGAFTTVPLPDQNGVPASAIVWMNPGPRAQALAALPEDQFDAEMTGRACALLGPMQRTGAVAVWPVITQRATRLTAERTALVAEAAHVLPPIGAQGLNTSLHDVAALYDLARAEPEALGAPAQLARYARLRERDIAMRARAIDLFNRICQSGEPAVQALRRAGLTSVHDIGPLRQSIMRAGLGSR